jgi:protein TonB
MKFTLLLISLLFYFSLNAQEDSTSTILTVAEQMPMFRDTACMKLTSFNEQKACADQKLLSFIYSHVNYPNALKEMGIEASVVISFVVEINGSLRDFQILRSNNPPLFAQELIRVIKLTTEENGLWIPAMQSGRSVPFRIHLPCKIQLN